MPELCCQAFGIITTLGGLDQAEASAMNDNRLGMSSLCQKTAHALRFSHTSLKSGGLEDAIIASRSINRTLCHASLGSWNDFAIAIASRTERLRLDSKGRCREQ